MVLKWLLKWLRRENMVLIFYEAPADENLKSWKVEQLKDLKKKKSLSGSVALNMHKTCKKQSKATNKDNN